jgi:Putative MetA-pathway of phenol degradation
MSQCKAAAKMSCTRCLAVFMLSIAVGAGALAADNSTNLENSIHSEIAAALQGRPILNWLLTWPEKEKQAGEEGENEEEKEKPLESDRPDFTDSSTTVGYRRLQIESGYKFTQAVAGDPTHNAHDLPEMLVRYGLAERLELRIAWDEGMVFESRRDRNTGRLMAESGSTDMGIGFKYALTQQDKWRPQSAIITSISAPVGSAELSSRQVDVLVNYLYSWDFTKKLSLNCSTGSLWTAESGDHFSQILQAASLEYELTEKLHVFNEWAVFLRRDFSDNRPQFYYDAGFTYLVTPNFQLDWEAGVGLNHAADGFFTGCGLVIRK